MFCDFPFGVAKPSPLALADGLYSILPAALYTARARPRLAFARGAAKARARTRRFVAGQKALIPRLAELLRLRAGIRWQQR